MKTGREKSLGMTMKQIEFVQQMERMTSAFSAKPLTNDALNIMYRRLKDFPFRVLYDAVDDLIIEEKYCPKFRELHGAMCRIMNARGLKIPSKEITVLIECGFCQDTGIRLRTFRRDMAKDFYCDCKAAAALEQKHDWTTGIWNLCVTAPTQKERMSFLQRAERTLKRPSKLTRDRRAEMERQLEIAKRLRDELLQRKET